MNLVVIPDDSREPGVELLLSLLVSQCPIASSVCNSLGLGRTSTDLAPQVIACPQSWADKGLIDDSRLTFHDRELADVAHLDASLPGWAILVDGRYACDLDIGWLARDLGEIEADAVIIDVNSKLNANHEKACFSSDNMVVGFRRRYSAVSHFSDPSSNGPHVVLVKLEGVQKIAKERGLFSDFSQWLSVLRKQDFKVDRLSVPGDVLDLSDPLEHLATKMQFGDSYAIEDEDSLTSTERNILLDAGWIVAFEKSKKKTVPGVPGASQVDVTHRQWIYTHGIDLATIRKMLGPMQER